MANAIASWLVAVSAALAAGSSMAAAQNAELSQAIDVLRAGSEELNREDAAYRSALAAAKISGREQAEYAEFVATLRVRVFEQCETVRELGGEEALQGFACIRMAPRQSLAVVSPAAVLTDEEKQAALNSRLNTLEGDIDESLMKRQQTIRQTATRTPSGGGGGGGGGAAGASAAGGSAGGAQGSPGSAQPGGQNSADSGREGSGSPAGQRSPSNASGPLDRSSAARQTPTDSGTDDDVVARQLREAAEKESDPVLKEKLWAEYRKYREAKR